MTSRIIEHRTSGGLRTVVGVCGWIVAVVRVGRVENRCRYIPDHPPESGSELISRVDRNVKRRSIEAGQYRLMEANLRQWLPISQSCLANTVTKESGIKKQRT